MFKKFFALGLVFELCFSSVFVTKIDACNTKLEEAKNISYQSIKAVVTDIEGTTTSISFVHDVLFPYAKKNMREFLLHHQHDLVVAQEVEHVKEILHQREATLEDVIAALQNWMNEDKKITPLKALQGLLWEDGYVKQQFEGHIYEDVVPQLMLWKNAGISLYVYSSGSIKAQKLLFTHSTQGDMTPLFSGYFDTTTGPKKEKSSYEAIAAQIHLDPSEIVFLSDSIDEVNAAKLAGMQTILISRYGYTTDALESVVEGFQFININNQ